MNKPFITTLLPTYQRPKHLARAVSSVRKQSYPHIKIAIFDNASQDETENLAKSWTKEDPRIVYRRWHQNLGGVANYVEASKSVDTPFFSFFADDDILLPDFYETAIKALQDHPEALFFVGLTLSCPEAGKVIKVPLDHWEREGLYMPDESLLKVIANLPTWTGMLFRKEVIEKFPFRPESFRLYRL